MGATVRRYSHAADYARVGRFLVRTYRTEGGHINWLQPRWEYMHFHPLIRRIELGSIGVWEADGDLVGVVHPEHSTGTAYFEIHPDHDALKKEMLEYAERHLSASDNGTRRLRAYINDRDDEFQRLAAAMGYLNGERRDPMSRFLIPAQFPAVPLPPGFRLRSLAEGNDLPKVTRLFWRGFGHGDDPPDNAIEERNFMQSAPNYRKDLNIVVEAPDGNFVSYCGMWYEPVHAIAYVEPVATDPDYRRMGLGRAAVLEGIRRCGELGATAAWVRTTKPFYLSLGFRPVYSSSTWEREWT